KASDKLDDDLDLVNDADELEELVEDIAARCGRDLRGIEDNPFLPITTVGSLVRYSTQPESPMYLRCGGKIGVRTDKWKVPDVYQP
ncbi:hypothetical protein KX262_23080, partial [Escherichia coli]|nr:hypothetical protein [Escherichia coli]